MPTPRLSDEDARAAYDAWEAHGRRADLAAVSLDMKPGKFDGRLRVAKERGMHLSPGARHSVSSAQLVPGEARGGHRRVYDESGKQIDTVRWSVPQDAPTAEDALAKVVAAFADIPAAPPIIQSPHSIKGKIGLFPQSDVHMGITITEARGGSAYSPKVALERMKDGFAQTHAAIPPCETAIILDNGDLTHANDDRDVTVKSEHRLKVEGSHRSNLDLCVIGKAWQIDLALQRSDRVIYRSNRGNHDPNTPDTMFLALSQRYRDEPRVTIDGGERDTWIYQRGKVFLSAHHGHGIKPEKLAANIPANFPQQFGNSRYWYLMTGHLHNPRQDTFGPFTWFQLPALCNMDQNSADMGYSDSAAMRAMMFCELGGLKHDMTVRF